MTFHSRNKIKEDALVSLVEGCNNGDVVNLAPTMSATLDDEIVKYIS